jgi:outer membrane protein assembly factor BamB
MKIPCMTNDASFHQRFSAYALVALVAFISIAAPSRSAAQSGGQLLWTVPLTNSPVTGAPRVATNGNIYFHSEDLYSISPGGHILWTKPSTDSKSVDIGPDGTVYSGSFRTVFAYSPSGQLRWSFTEPPGGQGLMAGPSVGADGNIYAISDQLGLGAFSLTPRGELRWSVPGYVNFQGTGLTPMPLGSNQLYFAEDIVPGCTGFSEGIDSVSFDGQLLWCVSLTSIARPIAAPNGDALVHDFSFLYDFRPDGSIAWSFEFPFPGGTLVGPSVAADGTIYIFHDLSDLWSFTPSGNKRWETDGVAGSNSPIPATVSPDGKTVVFGTVFAFGKNGGLVAVNAADGMVRWRLPITGASAGAAGPVAFNPDGKVVYLPVTEIAAGVNKLWAVSVTGGPTLTASGSCPGQAAVSASNLTPGGVAQVWASPGAGSTTISGGSCAGTILNLANARLSGTKTADSQGRFTLHPNLNSQMCARFIQTLDLSTCTTSNVGQFP